MANSKKNEHLSILIEKAKEAKRRGNFSEAIGFIIQYLENSEKKD